MLNKFIWILICVANNFHLCHITFRYWHTWCIRIYCWHPTFKNLSISSAEMTQYLCNIKIFGTNCIIKKYRVPFFNNVLKDKIVLNYMDRPARIKTLTLTEYSRYLQNKHSRNSFCYHIFYLHNIIQFAKQSNKHMSNIFDIDKFCQYSFFTKNVNKSFSNLYTLHMYRI